MNTCQTQNHLFPGWLWNPRKERILTVNNIKTGPVPIGNQTFDFTITPEGVVYVDILNKPTSGIGLAPPSQFESVKEAVHWFVQNGHTATTDAQFLENLPGPGADILRQQYKQLATAGG